MYTVHITPTIPFVFGRNMRGKPLQVEKTMRLSILGEPAQKSEDYYGTTDAVRPSRVEPCREATCHLPNALATPSLLSPSPFKITSLGGSIKRHPLSLNRRLLLSQPTHMWVSIKRRGKPHPARRASSGVEDERLPCPGIYATHPLPAEGYS